MIFQYFQLFCVDILFVNILNDGLATKVEGGTLESQINAEKRREKEIENESSLTRDMEMGKVQ